MTLSKEEFERWYRRLGLSDEAKAVIGQICTSPPARPMQSSAGNMSGTYPSIAQGSGAAARLSANDLVQDQSNCLSHDC